MSDFSSAEVRKMSENRKCVICGKIITEESPAILAVGAYGDHRCICSDCQALFDTATLGREYDKIAEAIETLCKKMVDTSPDAKTFEVASAILSDAAERAKLIKAGEYDFSLDEEDSDELDEIPEELRETEEDKEKDRRDEERAKKFDKVFNYITAGVFIVAAILIIVKLISTLL